MLLSLKPELLPRQAQLLRKEWNNTLSFRLRQFCLPLPPAHKTVLPGGQVKLVTTVPDTKLCYCKHHVPPPPENPLLAFEIPGFPEPASASLVCHLGILLCVASFLLDVARSLEKLLQDQVCACRDSLKAGAVARGGDSCIPSYCQA